MTHYSYFQSQTAYEEQITPFIVLSSANDDIEREKKTAYVTRKQDCPAGLNPFKITDSFFYA